MAALFFASRLSAADALRIQAGGVSLAEGQTLGCLDEIDDIRALVREKKFANHGTGCLVAWKDVAVQVSALEGLISNEPEWAFEAYVLGRVVVTHRNGGREIPALVRVDHAEELYAKVQEFEMQLARLEIDLLSTLSKEAQAQRKRKGGKNRGCSIQ